MIEVGTLHASSTIDGAPLSEPSTEPTVVDGPGAPTSIRASFLWGSYVLEVFSAADRAGFDQLYRQRLVSREHDQRALVPEGFEEFRLPGFCVVCQRPTLFRSELSAPTGGNGRTEVAWREQQTCDCGLNCRERSAYHVLSQFPGIARDAKIYCTERGHFFAHLAKAFPNAIASESLGDAVPLGRRNADGVRNEDLTRLTFADASIDCIVSLSAVGRVDDSVAALREAARCLKPGGFLLLTVPFRLDRADTIARAGVAAGHEFGWELLDTLKSAGFGAAELVVFTAPQYGYAGVQFVILATRAVAVEHDGAPPTSPETTKNAAPLPPALLVIAQEEQGLNFLEVLRAKLKDDYSNGQILCLVRKDDYSPAFRELKAKDGRITTFVVEHAMTDAELREALAERFAQKRVFWLRGDDRIHNRLVSPRPFRIQPDESISDYMDGDETTAAPVAYPEFVNINLTNRCNYTCFFCDLTIFGDNPDLPIEKLYSLRRLIRKVDIVDLTSLGEALLHPQIKDAIRFVTATNRGKGIALTTTGMLLTEEITRLLSERLYQLTISLNAGNPDTYRRDMGSKKWEKVHENVRVARTILPRDKITLSFVMHGDNLDEVEEFVRIAARLDVWHARLVGMVVQKPEFIRRSLWFHREKAKAVIERARQLGKELGVIVSDVYETVQEKSSSNDVACILPTQGSYILLNGDVMPCCYARPQTMGSVHHPGGFEAVWSGKKYRKLRKSLYFKQCETCIVFQEPALDSLERHFDGEVREELRKVLPLITVAVHDAKSPTELQAAVKQLKRQTYPFWEAVLVLDSSADEGTRQAANELGRTHENVRAVQHDQERETSTWNAGLSHARGELFCSMSAAQPFDPSRLEAYLKTLDRLGSECMMAYEARADGGEIDRTRAVFRTKWAGARELVLRSPSGQGCFATSFTSEGC